MVISASLQACGVVFPFAMPTSICRSIVTICSGLYLLIGMTRFSSKWILSHSTWYKFCRSRQRSVEFEIRGVPPTSRVRLSRVDSEHGNTLAANKSMGCPRYPTQAQVRALNGVAEADTTQSLRLSKGSIKLELPVNGVFLLEVLNK